MESIVFIGCGFFLCGCFRAISMSGAGENCFNKDLLMWRCLMKKKEVLGVLAVCGALLVVNPNSVFAADMGVTGQSNGAAVVSEEMEGDGRLLRGMKRLEVRKHLALCRWKRFARRDSG